MVQKEGTICSFNVDLVKEYGENDGNNEILGLTRVG